MAISETPTGEPQGLWKPSCSRSGCVYLKMYLRRQEVTWRPRKVAGINVLKSTDVSSQRNHRQPKNNLVLVPNSIAQAGLCQIEQVLGMNLCH
jgi:hypothetical protein